MEGNPLNDEGFVVRLGVNTAVCLGRLCRAEIGERCKLRGVDLHAVMGPAPDLTIDIDCDAPDLDCPGLLLIEPAANEAVALTRNENN